jgi:hypothetical protein
MVIKVNPLDPNSIDEARKKLKQYKKELASKTQRLVEILVNDGLLTAREFCPVATGTAQSSIIGYYDPAEKSGIIMAGGYCAFIEFGTGVGNLKHPSPEYIAAMGWAYGVGTHIFTTHDGRIGWYFPLENGEWRFTEGMPSRPFMYETMQILKQEYDRVAQEVFGGKG